MHVGPWTRIQMNCTTKMSKSGVRKRDGGVYALRVNSESIFRGRLWHKTHPNPRRSVRPSGVDRAWEIQSEHERQFVVSRSPFVPPFPLLHHHLLSTPPGKEHRIFANFSLLEIHGPHQGKNNNNFSPNISSADQFPRYLPANCPQVHWRWATSQPEISL